MRRTRAEAEHTRAAVLAAALTVFSARGFHAATLEEIATEAGLTRGSVYHHFANKADLYTALLLESGRRSADLVPAVVAEGGTFLEVVERLFVRQLLQVDEDPGLRALAVFALRSDFGAVPDVAARIVARHTETLSRLSDAFAQAQSEGVVRTDLSPPDLARAFVALENGLVHLSTLPGQRDVVRESGPALARVLVAGLAVLR